MVKAVCYTALDYQVRPPLFCPKFTQVTPRAKLTSVWLSEHYKHIQYTKRKKKNVQIMNLAVYMYVVWNYRCQINWQHSYIHTNGWVQWKLFSIDSHTHLLGSLGSHGVRDRSSEQQDVWLWLVYHVVNPALRLLHTYRSPLCFRHELVFWHHLRNVLWKHDMSIWMW